MAQLLDETRKTTVYLRHFVKVVELWECEWKEMRRDPVVKRCLDAAFPRRRRHVRWTMTTQQILSGVRTGTVFGMIECDIRVPEELREHFAEMQPVFKNIRLMREDLGPFMRRYAEAHNIMTTTRRMLVGSYYGDKILLATPLLRWYLDHGLEVLHVYQVIEYDPIPCFRLFGDAVSKARREGDVHRDRTIIADTMKLLGNSGYGKTITNVDRHRDVKYCTEKTASRLINDKRFRQLDIVVDDAYEIEMSKRTVAYTLPVHVGFFVLQYAKMRMLQFYYDFIDRYVERPLFQYCEMDTDRQRLFGLGRRVRRCPRDPYTARSLFSTSFRMAPVRMLRRASGRVRALSTRRSTLGRRRGVLQGSQSVRQEDTRSVQGRVVRRRIRGVVQQDVLLFRSHRQVQHQRSEQTSQRHRQGCVPGGAHQPSERKWKEPWVPGA